MSNDDYILNVVQILSQTPIRLQFSNFDSSQIIFNWNINFKICEFKFWIDILLFFKIYKTKIHFKKSMWVIND